MHFVECSTTYLPNPYHMRTKRTVPAAQAETAFWKGQVLEVTITSEDMNQIAIEGFDPIAEMG